MEEEDEEEAEDPTEVEDEAPCAPFCPEWSGFA